MTSEDLIALSHDTVKPVKHYNVGHGSAVLQLSVESGEELLSELDAVLRGEESPRMFAVWDLHGLVFLPLSSATAMTIRPVY